MRPGSILTPIGGAPSELPNRVMPARGRGSPGSRSVMTRCDQIILSRTPGIRVLAAKSQNLAYWRSTLRRALSMTTRFRSPAVPREVIRLSAYAQLDLYLTKFARGELGLVLLLGRHGTGKSESVRKGLGLSEATASDESAAVRGALYVEGHMQPFGLYRQLWDYRNQAIVLDDLDRLYADPDCVRLLKPLCNTVREKRLHWLTNLTMNDGELPSSFTTASCVILIANEWKSLNPNVRALEDRAIILHFCPPNDEVHRKVGEWFDDSEVYDFVGKVLPSCRGASHGTSRRGSRRSSEHSGILRFGCQRRPPIAADRPRGRAVGIGVRDAPDAADAVHGRGLCAEKPDTISPSSSSGGTALLHSHP